jgi:ATP-dependent RNA helicase SUPV3L1/SUV3
LESAPIKGAARGLAFQLKEGLGSLKRGDAADQINALSRDDRRQLRALGVRIGRDMAFLPALLKPDAVRWRALLWALHANRAGLPDLPPAGRVSVPATKNFEPDFLEACGYRILGPLAVRIDMAERLTSKAWLLAKSGPFKPTVELTSMIGAGNTELPGVLAALGFKRIQKTGADGTPEDRFRPIRRPHKNAVPTGKKNRPRSKADNPVVVAHDPHSPFAKLKDFSFGD